MSWGDIAVGFERRSFSHPSKSAILGLVAAALGIKRDDEARQQQLDEQIVFGVKLISPGVVIRDFHTAQVPEGDRKLRFSTRRDEMFYNPEKIATVLSRREYLCDSFAVIAIRLKDTPNGFSLEDVKSALEKPVFHLYLGRKSCPPAIPLLPLIDDAKDMKTALDMKSFPEMSSLSLGERNERLKIIFNRNDVKTFYKGHVIYYWEEKSEAGLEYMQRTIRYDQPLSRKRWQFSPRNEYMRVIERSEENVHK
jgi:CRISPR system Cascade subunit CasD